ncbi:beta-1-adrenergic receptor [Elysia marginata]|uniref:Beta-1-adrenergic receptor n=1 Tax=Elysia marginata TaxID=1093978 RepID=A0AAV4FQR0_9GAST|nr:beta-1-adrenergic receptor [Elysia marginata]
MAAEVVAEWTEMLTTQAVPNVTFGIGDVTEREPGLDRRPASWVFMVFTGACLALAVFILVCNTVFIAACWKTRSLRTISMLYVISLAGSDMLQGVGMILQAFFYANEWVGFVMWTDFLCPWIIAIFLTCVPISILNVAFIAFDRYVYIVFPYRYPALVTAKRSKVIIAFTWLVWLSFGFSILNQPKESSDCRIRTMVRVSYIWIRFVVFFLSVAVSGFCHVSIQLTALKHIRQVGSYLNNLDKKK